MIIEIWSDVMCPFCYIGKRHLEEALAGFDGAGDIAIEWKSFQLNPQLKKQGDVNVVEYLAKAKGITLEESKAMHDRVVAMARNAGLEFRFDKAVVANSFQAHRILQRAKELGKGDLLKELFLKGYFEEGMDMEDTNQLLERALKVGLSEDDVHNALTDGKYAELVNDDVALAARFGARGVPFFVFDRKYAISGAQPVETFSQVIEKSFGEWKQDRMDIQVVESGDSCDINGNC